jgi:hypothetical protein
MVRTLIVGTGIAATAYAKTQPAKFGEIREVVGGSHLWQASRIDGHHLMGQPGHLLTGNVLADPGRGQVPNGPAFLQAGQFAALTDTALRESVDLLTPGEVSNIKRGGASLKQYIVTLKDGRSGICDNVILAMGPGDNRLIKLTKSEDDPGLDTSKFENHVITGDDFMSPGWTAPPSMLSTKEIAIYGGSATAAWIAETAAARGLKVALWFTREGDGPADKWDADKRFAAAFPPGSRNTKVKDDFDRVRKVVNLTGVALRSAGSYRWLSLQVQTSSGPEVWLPDLLVYALGYEHTALTGVGKILDTNLRNELVPYYDRNRLISDKQCLLAIGTTDQSLMMVGSGMVSSGGIDRAKLSRELGTYGQISLTLPPAARPPEGIAMVLAGIEALNQFIPAKATGTAQTIGSKFQDHINFTWDINFNTCNRTQLALYLAQASDLIPFAANVAVELVIRLRTDRTRVLGEMDREKVRRICVYCEEMAKILKRQAVTLEWLNEKISGGSTDDTIKRAHYHEELTTYILHHNLLRFTL